MPVRNVGKDCDVKFVENIKTLFNDKLGISLLTTPPFHSFDLKDKENKIVIEVKRRYINHDAYPTMIMNYSKYKKAKQYIQRQYSVYFVMHYNDGIYYHKYNGETYNLVKVPRHDRGTISDCVNIPINLLEKFETVEYDF
jgi:hypothetical protein